MWVPTVPGKAGGGREGRPPPYVPTCAQPISADSLRLMINVDEG